MKRRAFLKALLVAPAIAKAEIPEIEDWEFGPESVFWDLGRSGKTIVFWSRSNGKTHFNQLLAEQMTLYPPRLTPIDTCGILEPRTNPETNMSSLKDLCAEMAHVAQDLAEASEAKSAIQKRYDHLRYVAIPEKMQEEGVRNMTFEDIGRVQTTSEIRVTVPAANKEELQEWFRENEMGEMVQPTINSSSLKAWAKERLKAGEEIPSDLIKVEAYERASITKT